jgi:hypothetical protein
MATSALQDASKATRSALQAVRSEIMALERQLGAMRSEEQKLEIALQTLGTAHAGSSTGANSRRRPAGRPAATRSRARRGRARSTSAAAAAASAPSTRRSASATAASASRGAATTTRSRSRSGGRVTQDAREQEVLAFIGNRPKSAMDIAKHLEVSGARSRQLIDDMKKKKMIVEAKETGVGGRGRPTKLWQPASAR